MTFSLFLVIGKSSNSSSSDTLARRNKLQFIATTRNTSMWRGHHVNNSLDFDAGDLGHGFWNNAKAYCSIFDYHFGALDSYRSNHMSNRTRMHHATLLHETPSTAKLTPTVRQPWLPSVCCNAAPICQWRCPSDGSRCARRYPLISVPPTTESTFTE